MSLDIRVMEISRRTGISAAHVSKIFSGKRIPSLTNAALIATCLKISIDELYMHLCRVQERIEESSNEEAAASAQG